MAINYFPTSLNTAFALPRETETRKLHLFTYTLYVAMPTNTQAHSKFLTITWSQFAKQSTVCTKHNLGRKQGMLPSVSIHSSFAKSLLAVSKMGVVIRRGCSESQ